MESNSLLKRLEMYAMINAIENDLVDNLTIKTTDYWGYKANHLSPLGSRT